MTDDINLIQNHLESESNALYFINSFMMRLPIGNKLFSSDKASIIDLGTFIHEYIHYLQNSATIAGVYEFTVQLRLLFCFSMTLDESRCSVGSESLDVNIQSSINDIFRYQHVLRGDRFPQDNIYRIHRSDIHIKVSNISCLKQQFKLPEAHETEQVILSLIVESKNAAPTNHQMSFGTNCICEGLAWELERNLLKIELSEDELNSISPPASPYKILRAVYEYYMGSQKSSGNLIRCGLIALQSESPASIFIDICQNLKTHGPLAHDAEFPLDIVNKMQEVVGESVDQLFNQMVDPMIKNFAGLGPLKSTFLAIQNNYKKYMQIRLNDPFFEMSLVDSTRDLQSLIEMLMSMPPCPIIQTLDEENEEGRTEVISWFDGHLGLDKKNNINANVDGLGVYQSMNAFFGSHAINSKIYPTKFLIDNNNNDSIIKRVCCPFINSCGAPQTIHSPKICRESPWESPVNHNSSCWYAVGAAVLQKGAPTFFVT